MHESTVTAKGQTTLPRDVRMELHLTSGDRVRYIILDNEVRMMKARSVKELKGVLARARRQKAVSLDEMEAAIAECASQKAG